MPKNWFKRGLEKARGLITQQENIWLQITMAMQMAKRKASKTNLLTFSTTKYVEDESLYFQLEWLKVEIKGTPDQEQEEYGEALTIYKQISKVFKKDPLVKNKDLSKPFKTMQLSPQQFKKVYEIGLKEESDNNIAKILLDLGIIIHIEKI
jgi:hypothetical protein